MSPETLESMRQQEDAVVEMAKKKVSTAACKCSSPFQPCAHRQTLVYSPPHKGMADALFFRCAQHPTCQLEATVLVSLKGEVYDRMARAHEAMQGANVAVTTTALAVLQDDKNTDGPPAN